MVEETPNHELHKYEPGDTDWTHSPDMQHIEERLVIRDVEANRSRYTPHPTATFIATDTGAVYDGDGEAWNAATRAFESIRTKALSVGDEGPVTSLSDLGGGVRTDAVVVGEGNTYRAIDGTGALIERGPRAAPVINAAIDSVADDGGGRVRLTDTFTVTESVRGAESVTLDGGHPQGGGLYLAPGANTDLVRVPPDANHFGVTNCYLGGNAAENSRGSAISLAGYLYKPRLESLLIRDCPGPGIDTENATGRIFEPYWTALDIGTCTTGIRVDGTVDIVAQEIYSHDNEQHGIDVRAPGHSWHHAHAYNNGKHGIVLRAGASENWFHTPFLDTNGKHGLLVEGVSRNFLVGGHGFNNSTAARGTYDAIRLADATNTFVAFTVVQDYQSTRTQNHGVNETGSSDENVVFATVGKDNLGSVVNLSGDDSSQEYVF